MIELYELEQLLAFAQYGTLSKAAEKMNLSQPSLTRTMQHIEDEFRVSLFLRSKNRIELNENGKLAVDYTKKVFDDMRDMMEQVRAHDRSQRTITVASYTPAPLWDIPRIFSDYFPELTVSTEIKNWEQIRLGLKEGIYQFAFLPEMLDSPDYISFPAMKEHLYFAFAPDHALAQEKELYFKDADGFNFLLRSDIGFWDLLCRKKMPSSRFLIQTEGIVFTELIKSTSLPCFTSDLVMERAGIDNRISIPILDDEATQTYYLTYKKEYQKIFLPAIEQIKRQKL